MSEDNLLTVREVSTYLKLTERTVRDMIDREDLPAIKIGKAYRIRHSELERFILELETKQ